MQKIYFFILISLVSAFAGTQPLIAGPKNGDTPAVESVCDVLKSGGVTKGLYGLCVAYCEAEANSESVLDNYNRKKTESDPAMPCLEVTPPKLNCACWSNLTAEELGTSFDLAFCTLGGIDLVTYGDESSGEQMGAFDGGCIYQNSLTGDSAQLELTTEESNECRLEILNALGDDALNCAPN